MLPFLSPQLQHPIAIYAYIDIKKKNHKFCYMLCIVIIIINKPIGGIEITPPNVSLVSLVGIIPFSNLTIGAIYSY
jgi:hypothetical protein